MLNNALFTIRIAAQLTGLHAQTIRKYESRGLITPQRSAGGTRLYSEQDIIRLREIADLSDAGISIEGISRILELESEIAALEASVDRLLADNARLKAALFQSQRSQQTTAIVIRNTPLPPVRLRS